MLRKGREGYDNPQTIMTGRRIILLVLGLAGSLLAASMLYASVAKGIVADGMQEVGAVSGELAVPADRFFPNRVQGTALMVMAMSSYDGPYLEDGSDTEVFGITALQVINTGEDTIPRCLIRLCCDETILIFDGEQIPPGVPVVLLERNAATYKNRNVAECSGWQMAAFDDLYAGKQVLVDDRAMGTLVITNVSGQTLRNIRIHYKNWLQSPGFFIGGIAYMVTIPELKDGQTELLYPYHYAKGYTKVVSVVADT